MRFVGLGKTIYGGIFRDYVEGFGVVSRFFDYDPAREDSFKLRAERVRELFRGDRKLLSDALVHINESFGLSERTIENARKLGDEDTLAVVTGQQIGFCTGPLFTVHKAISAVKLSQRLEASLGTSVVPVFWMATDDHDLSEVDRLAIPSPDGSVLRLVLPLRAPKGLPAGRIRLPEEAESVLNGFLESLEGPHREEVLDAVATAFRSSETLSDFFARLMGWLFSRHGLVLLDPSHSALRRAAVEPISRWVEGIGLIRDVLTETHEALRGCGYATTSKLDPGDLYLFRLMDGKRVGLRLDCVGEGRGCDRFSTRRGETRWSSEDLLREIRSDPDGFSPGFLLRPIVQEYLIPTVAVISGPGELGYVSLLKKIYGFFGLEMPIIAPRLSLTLIRRDLEELMQCHNLGFESMAGDFESELERMLNDVDGIDIGTRFGRLHEELERSMAEIRSSYHHFGDSFDGAMSRALRQIKAVLGGLEREARRLRRRRMPQIVGQMRRLKAELWPNGRPQETVINPLYYISKTGPRLIDELLEAGGLSPGFHHLCFLEEV